MPTLTSLSAADLRQAVLRFRDALRAHQEELNRLNVYPVPDGDTGTNMALTLESVSAELADRRVDGRGVPRDQPRLAHGRPRQLRRDPVADPARARRGLPRPLDAVGAADLARRAAPRRRRRVRSGDAPGRGHDPHRRARESAEAVEALDGDRRSSTLLERADDARARRGRAHARAAARRCATPASSTRAARASRCCSPRSSRSCRRPRDPRARGRRPRPPSVAAHLAGRRRVEPALRGHVPPRRARRHDARRSATRGARSATRSSSSAATALWNCHVHTNDIGAAVEAGIDAGRPHKIRVTDLIEQVEEERWVREADVRRRPRRVRRPDRRHHRGRRGRRRRRGSAACSRASACSRSSPAASR